MILTSFLPRILTTLSLVAQTLVGSFRGLDTLSESRPLIEQSTIGNIFLTTESIHGEHNPAHSTAEGQAERFPDGVGVHELVLGLQEAAQASNHPHPLLVGIEQEGGLVRTHLLKSLLAEASIHPSFTDILDRVSNQYDFEQ